MDYMSDKEQIVELLKQNEQLKKEVYDLKQNKTLFHKACIDISDVIQLSQMKMIDKDTAKLFVVYKLLKALDVVNDLF